MPYFNCFYLKIFVDKNCTTFLVLAKKYLESDKLKIVTKLKIQNKIKAYIGPLPLNNVTY